MCSDCQVNKHQKNELPHFDSYLETTPPHSLKCQHSYHGQKFEEMVLAETLAGSIEQWHVYLFFK